MIMMWLALPAMGLLTTPFRSAAGQRVAVTCCSPQPVQEERRARSRVRAETGDMTLMLGPLRTICMYTTVSLATRTRNPHLLYVYQIIKLTFHLFYTIKINQPTLGVLSLRFVPRLIYIYRSYDNISFNIGTYVSYVHPHPSDHTHDFVMTTLPRPLSCRPAAALPAAAWRSHRTAAPHAPNA